MPAPFQRLSIDQFAAVLKTFDFRRRITGVHMHHTWRPNHAQWKGHESMVGMWRFHTQDRGFSDIAQHLTIDPEGFVWTGRNWNSAPASAVGHNGTGLAGPFMFEIVGDFDLGRDPLQGAQRHTVLDVISLVQMRFGLTPESLMFHNQAAAKTCPGSSIPYDEFIVELRAHVVAPRSVPGTTARGRGTARPRAMLPLPDSAMADTALVQRTLRLIEPDGASRSVVMSTPLEELDYGYATEVAARGAPAATGSRGAGDTLTPEQIDALRPYVLNLRMGRFSTSGLMTSSAADVRMIVHEHLRPAAAAAAAEGRPLRIVLYAHGGLVKESLGLATAQAQVGWWLANGVYPIHFVWETGLFETIKSLLERSRSPLRGRGLGDLITDHLTDPLLERTARVLRADKIWDGMKAGAQLASGTEGGALVFLQALAEFAAGGAKVELHAVGHSAGAIFQAYLLPAAKALDLPAFRTLQLMAPAVRADTFRTLTEPLLGPDHGVDALTVYTMRRDFERDDNCAGIYRKSLLYFVSGACEAEIDAPLLGLEDALRADPGLAALFGLGQPGAGTAEVVWSKSVLTEGRSATRAVHHGDFDNDAPTMNSVMRRVLGLDDADPLPVTFPVAGSRSPADPWQDTVDWPAELLDNMPLRPSAPVAVSAPSHAAAPGSARRVALCVGIDNYPTAPLSGCQNDARLWQTTLQRLGFDAALLLDPRRNELFGAIETLFTSARPGDEVVLQYAGHGTQVDDLDGDEANGDTPGLDEALCPLDFADGALFIDDDLGALIDRLDRGARLTLFMDCCHSGSNARLAGQRVTPPSPDAKARFVRPTAALQEAHRRWREHEGSSIAARGIEHPELLFTACRSDQVAWESGGHGEFTLRATGVLATVGASVVARAVHQRVVDAFGPNPRQQPLLDGPAARLDELLFGSPQASRP